MYKNVLFLSQFIKHFVKNTKQVKNISGCFVMTQLLVQEHSICQNETKHKIYFVKTYQ